MQINTINYVAIEPKVCGPNIYFFNTEIEDSKEPI